MTVWPIIEELLLEYRRDVQVHMLGTSMYPALFAGDKVTLSPLASNKLEDGDIVLVKTQNRYLIHRYFASEARTKGDNLEGWDPRPEHFLGRVTVVEKTYISQIKRFVYRTIQALAKLSKRTARPS